MNTADINEIQANLKIFQDAYLARSNEELEKRVNDALDSIISCGDVGLKALMTEFQTNMHLRGDNLSTTFDGDLAWNEWIKKRMIVRALERSQVKSTIPDLVPFLNVRCSETQFYQIFQPAVAKAVGNMGDKSLIPTLKEALNNTRTSGDAKREISQALEKLGEKVVETPELLAAEIKTLRNTPNSTQEFIAAYERLTPEVMIKLDPDTKYFLLFWKGEYYEKTGDLKKAVQCYKESLGYVPGGSGPLGRLAAIKKKKWWWKI